MQNEDAGEKNPSVPSQHLLFLIGKECARRADRPGFQFWPCRLFTGSATTGCDLSVISLRSFDDKLRSLTLCR